MKWVSTQLRLPTICKHYHTKWHNKISTDIDTRYWSGTANAKAIWQQNVHEWLDESEPSAIEIGRAFDVWSEPEYIGSAYDVWKAAIKWYKS